MRQFKKQTQIDPLVFRHPMRPAIKRPIRPSALDVGVEVLAQRWCCQQPVNCAFVDFTVMVVGAIQRDDHVLLGCIIANALHDAATVNVLALESLKWNVTPILDAHGFGVGRVE